MAADADLDRRMDAARGTSRTTAFQIASTWSALHAGGLGAGLVGDGRDRVEVLRDPDPAQRIGHERQARYGRDHQGVETRGPATRPSTAILCGTTARIRARRVRLPGQAGGPPLVYEGGSG